MVTATRLTYQDYINTPDDERYELIDGELIMAPGPISPHQISQSELSYWLQIFVKQHDSGQILYAPIDVVLSDADVVQPDLIFISKEREHIIEHANIQGAPDFVAEILSPATARRDWGVKRELYAKHGVKEYWILDPINKKVWVMLLRNGALEIVQSCGAGDIVTSSVLAGFSVAVDDIFQD